MQNFILLQNTNSPNMMTNLIDLLLNKLILLGGRIIVALIFYLIALRVISWIRKLVKGILIRKNVDKTVVSFINSVLYATLQIIVVIIIIGILGIETTSLAAVFAAIGLAVGMSMKDNLSNFAGGVMILINKPFKLGHRIAAQSMDGVVEDIGILYTVLLTADNRTIYLPNGPLSTGSIINYSNQSTRRVDIILNFNYGNDVDKIKLILNNIIDENSKIQKDPTSSVSVTMLNNGNFDIAVRVWVLSSDFSFVNTNLNEAIYKKLSEEGIFSSSVLMVKMKE